MGVEDGVGVDERDEREDRKEWYLDDDVDEDRKEWYLDDDGDEDRKEWYLDDDGDDGVELFVIILLHNIIKKKENLN